MVLGFSQFKRPPVNIQNILLKKYFFFADCFSRNKKTLIFSYIPLQEVWWHSTGLSWPKECLSVWGVCVYCALSLSPLHAFLQVSMPQHFSNTEKKKSNTIGKGEARISRWQLDSYVLLLSIVTEPSTEHSIKSPSESPSRESNRLGCGQKRCSKLY